MRKAIIIMLSLAAVVSTIYAGLETANAGAWCSQVNTGAGRIEEDCGFASEEACRRTVLAGNRGFCIRNPAYQSPTVQSRRRPR